VGRADLPRRHRARHAARRLADRPHDGRPADGAGALGIPVSTTHTITGAIVGVGSTRRLSAVRWGVARNVVWAWVLPIPCTAAIAALVYLPFRRL